MPFKDSFQLKLFNDSVKTLCWVGSAMVKANLGQVRQWVKPACPALCSSKSDVHACVGHLVAVLLMKRKKHSWKVSCLILKYVVYKVGWVNHHLQRSVSLQGLQDSWRWLMLQTLHITLNCLKSGNMKFNILSCSWNNWVCMWKTTSSFESHH